MREVTALNRISKIIDSMDYKSAYIEIQTKSNKYVLEKENQKKIIGFSATESKENK